MKKILLTLILFFSALFGTDYSVDASYDIGYGFFGRVGKARATLEIDNKTYMIRIKARATGLAKLLSRNRVEIYESSGVVKNGVLIPQIFVFSKIKDGKKDIKRYMFDHDKKSIKLLRSKRVVDKSIETKKDLPYYSKNDILSLFFNLKHILREDLNISKSIRLIAVGASDKSGKIDLRPLSKKELKEISKLLKKSDHLLFVTLNQKIFSSQKGEMYINLNDDGICTSALLKDVIMFGDIRGKLKKLDIKGKR